MSSLSGEEKRYAVVSLTNIDNSYVDAVDKRQEEFIGDLQSDFHLSQAMDDRSVEIFTAPSKHARDVYHRLWLEGLGSDYSEEQIVDSGAVNQFHHNASLIADDHMDNDDTRRGVETFHNSAFLTSDYPEDIVSALTMSEVIKLTSIPYTAISASDIPAKDHSSMNGILGEQISHLAEGQNEDLTGPARLEIEEGEAYVESGDERVSIPEYYFPMTEGKTGSLFKASAGTAAVAADYSGEEPYEHARELGWLLQTTDDIADVRGADKDVMSDFAEGKPNMVVDYGLEELEGYNQRKMVEVLEDENPSENDLYEVRDILIENGVLDRAYDEASEHYENSARIVDEAPLEHPEYGEDLNSLGKIVLERAN